MEKFRKYFFVGGVFAAIHTTLFLLIAALMIFNLEAGMAYSIFFPLDYPLSRLYAWVGVPAALVFGGLLWFFYGFVLQSFFRLRRKIDFLPLIIGLFFLGLWYVLPDIYLKSLPNWQNEWNQGTYAANSRELDKAIKYVSKAVEFSPKDNSILDGMWDYLGNLYMQQTNYENAGKAFVNALNIATTKPTSRPVDILNAYNRLAWFYERTGNKQNEKESLQKAIEFNRTVYGGDSVQEANCWHELAEIAHDDGNPVEAESLIKKAIAMDEKLPQPDSWSVNYMKDQLAKWTDK